MNTTKYLKYFYHLWRNWDFRLAADIIYHEIRGENKYHINTTVMDYLNNEKIESSNFKYGSIYQGVPYDLAEKAFDYLREEKATSHIIDFGSGKGRVLAVAASYGFKNITGVDFAPSLCREAERNIEKIKPMFPSILFKISCSDAADYKIEKDTNVFFFFNPFGKIIMLQVVKNILASLKENNRKIYAVYVNPEHKDIFLSAGFAEEYYFRKMEYVEMIIFSMEIKSQ